MPKLATLSRRDDPFDQKVREIFQHVAGRLNPPISISQGFDQLHDLAFYEFRKLVKSRCSRPDVAFDVNELWSEFMTKLFTSYLSSPDLFFTGSPRGLFIHMIEHATADLWRKYNRHQVTRGGALDDFRELAASDEDPHQLAVRAETNRRIEAVMDDLPLKDREILRLADSDWPRHVAPELGMTARKFAHAAASARKRFKSAWIARYGDTL